MNQPDNFGLDLATRVALHEMLIQKLFLELIERMPNSYGALADLRESLAGSFELEALIPEGASLDAQQQDWVRQQSAYGKELAERFIRKLEARL